MGILGKIKRVFKPKKKSPPKGWRVIGGKDNIPADPNKAKAKPKLKIKIPKAKKRKASKGSRAIWNKIV